MELDNSDKKHNFSNEQRCHKVLVNGVAVSLQIPNNETMPVAK